MPEQVDPSVDSTYLGRGATYADALGSALLALADAEGVPILDAKHAFVAGFLSSDSTLNPQGVCVTVWRRPGKAKPSGKLRTHEHSRELLDAVSRLEELQSRAAELVKACESADGSSGSFDKISDDAYHLQLHAMGCTNQIYALQTTLDIERARLSRERARISR